MTSSGTVSGPPSLDPVILDRRCGDQRQIAVQLLDLRGGPTEPIRVRVVEAQPPASDGAPLRRIAPGPEAEAGVSFALDPRTGRPIDGSEASWSRHLSQDLVSQAEAVRRYARARTGVNRLGSMERHGWSPGLLLTRRQIFPLMPPHLVWLGEEAWTADEVCCVSPTCSCRDLFIDFEPLTIPLGESKILSASMHIDQWMVTKTWGKGPGRALAEAWMAQPGARERALDLFDAAHRAGGELLDPFTARRGVVRPEGRCPCGSHRKFSRCCARSTPPRVPGSLHALQARAHDALLDFATRELGEPLALEPTEQISKPAATPSAAARWAWLLYWRRYDGFTLADRFLADPGRGDPWLRCWLEAASGTPPEILEVQSLRGRDARMENLADLERPGHEVSLAPQDQVRARDVVFAAPVRVMGRTVLLGTWRMPSDKDIALKLVSELKTVRDPIDRLRRPERVLQAMFEVQAGLASA
ncbi:MAG: SEC-C domain-containing protein [Pseudomonadota bacterium]